MLGDALADAVEAGEAFQFDWSEDWAINAGERTKLQVAHSKLSHSRARFPAHKDLAGFHFVSSEVNEAMVHQLHRGEFIDGAHNVVLIGGPGTGKTHIATALGIQAVEHHRKKVRFFATVDLVNALEQEKATNKAGQHRRAPGAP